MRIDSRTTDMTFEMHEWAPDSEGPALWYGPFAAESWRYLWFDKMIPNWVLRVRNMNAPHTYLEGKTGDVWIIQPQSAPEPRLIFIGPVEERGHTHVLADWNVPCNEEEKEVELGQKFIHLFQPGPDRRKPLQKSVYDHLREPKV
jgi:hypothetical protein